MRRFPRAAWFVPDAVARRRWLRRTVEKARRADPALHLTHAECLDGSACDALVRMALGQGVRTVWLDPADALAALRAAGEVDGAGRRLIVSDLSLQKGQGEAASAVLARLAGRGWRVEWRDHHAKQWSPADLPRLDAHAAVRVDLEGKECGATLVASDLLPHDPFARELAAVVRDHDLWILADPRSLALKDAAVHLGSQRFVRQLLASRRLDDPLLASATAAEQEEKRAAIAWGLARARVVSGQKGKVGAVYGEVPTNEVLHELLTARGCDAAVLFKPGGGFSLRSRRGMEICHEVAGRFGGGGHPNASGGKLRLSVWSWPAYWARGTGHPAALRVIHALGKEVDGVLGP